MVCDSESMKLHTSSSMSPIGSFPSWRKRENASRIVSSCSIDSSRKRSAFVTALSSNAKKFGPPAVVNDGVSIAKEIELKDPFENMGAQLAKEIATKTNDVAGDGTTTATVLGQAMVREGMKNVAAGANPMALKRGLEVGVQAVLKSLREMASPVEGATRLEQIATIADGDEEVGT